MFSCSLVSLSTKASAKKICNIKVFFPRTRVVCSPGTHKWTLDILVAHFWRQQLDFCEQRELNIFFLIELGSDFEWDSSRWGGHTVTTDQRGTIRLHTSWPADDAVQWIQITSYPFRLWKMIMEKFTTLFVYQPAVLLLRCNGHHRCCHWLRRGDVHPKIGSGWETDFWKNWMR